jgi:drug/metabolite transporter (DMT)-like permease
MILFYGAVKLVGASTASLLATVEPLVAVLLAYVVLDESLEAMQLAGGALILCGVVSLTLPVGARGAQVAPASHT